MTQTLKLAFNLLRERMHFFALGLFFILAFFAMLSTAIIVHISIMPVGFIAEAEAATGQSLAGNVYLPGAIASLCIQVAGAVAMLHEYVTSQ